MSNIVTAIGGLTKDPESFESKSGKKYTKFGLSCGDGLKECYLDCIAFDVLSDQIKTYKKQGDRVFVSGHLESAKSVKTDGSTVMVARFVIKECEFL